MKLKTALVITLIISLCFTGVIFWYIKKTDLSQTLMPQIKNPKYLNAQITLCMKQIYGYDILERRARGEFVTPPDFNERVSECMDELTLFN